MKSPHSSLKDEEFAHRFAALTLPPSWFNHEAHLRLAYILLQKSDVGQAADQMCQQIAAFDRAHGDGLKYHRTITVAAVKTMAHFMGRAPNATFPQLLDIFPRLLNNFKGLLEAHYSQQVLNNPRAKDEFLQPDLQPYDS